MGILKAIILIAITMALSIALTMNNLITHQQKEESSKPAFAVHDFPSQEEGYNKLFLPSKRVSRFLAQNDNPRNPNAADHCHKDYEICYLTGAKNSTCCNNKCIDTGYDKHNCGTCKKKCKYTETCCRGQCVDTQYDKRHCGECNHRCELGQYCVYGLCDYA